MRLRQGWIPVSSTGMTPFVVNSLLLYGLAAILNRYKLLLANRCNFYIVKLRNEIPALHAAKEWATGFSYKQWLYKKSIIILTLYIKILIQLIPTRQRWQAKCFPFFIECHKACIFYVFPQLLSLFHENFYCIFVIRQAQIFTKSWYQPRIQVTDNIF